VLIVGGIGAGIASQGLPIIATMTRGLAERFDVTVYSLHATDPGFVSRHYGVRSPPRWLAARAAKKLRWPWLALQFMRDHARRPYGALFSFGGYPMGPVAVGLASLVRRPSVVTLLGAEAARVPSIGYGQLRRPFNRRVVMSTCKEASAVVVISRQQADALRWEGLTRSDLDVIPLGVDRTWSRPPRATFVAPLKLLHVANLTKVKDQSTLLRGFALLRKDIDARLRIVGPDFMDGALKRLACELGLGQDIEFVGAVPNGALPAHYDWADMFVLTSLSEGQNNAVTEAAMAGLLPVGTPVGCLADLGEAGAVLVRFADPADLAAKIRAVAGDRAAWERKAAYAHAWAEAHDLRWSVGRLTAVVDRVMS
jgi:glycosyltransferase involved in cell wall biosynthesis